jgi:hypothetical protein
MTVTNARPSPFLTLTTDADWESFTNGAGNGDGVVMSPSTSLAPSLDTGGRNAVMAAGTAIIKGKLWSCDAPVSTAVPVASAQNRIDRLVLQLNRSAGTAAAFVQPVVVTGTPSGTPTIPALTQGSSGVWQLPISHWTSTSAGGLTSLVDERIDVGKTMLSGLAANMPTWLIRPTLYFQTDTGDLYIWYGSSWNFLSQAPSASQSMPAMTSGWNIGGLAKYKLNGDGDLQVSFRNLHSNGTQTNDGYNIWAAGSFSGNYLVPDYRRVPCYTDSLIWTSGTNRSEAAALEFAPDGSVSIFSVSQFATRVDCFATIPMWS